MGSCVSNPSSYRQSNAYRNNSSNTSRSRLRRRTAVQRKVTRRRYVFDKCIHLVTRRNKPLIRENLKWISEVPITESELKLKREEFWETAPVFEGRKEIWDALRGAVQFIYQYDYESAQSIISCAGITCPTGSLMFCYDELGNQYQLPPLVLSAPSNLLSDADVVQSDEQNDTNSDANTAFELPIKFRLSSSEKDVKMLVKSNEKILDVKNRIQEKFDIEPSRQRMFFGGKLLRDKQTIASCSLKKNCVVQVIIKERTL